MFVSPPWGGIYSNDAERRQPFEEGVEAYHEVVAAYAECGYRLEEVPTLAVCARVDFILEQSVGDVG